MNIQIITIIILLIIILIIELIHHYAIIVLSKKLCKSCMFKNNCTIKPYKCDSYISKM